MWMPVCVLVWLRSSVRSCNKFAGKPKDTRGTLPPRGWQEYSAKVLVRRWLSRYWSAIRMLRTTAAASSTGYRRLSEARGEVQNPARGRSISGIDDWREITPDQHNDWIGQRDEAFQKALSYWDRKRRRQVGRTRRYSSCLATAIIRGKIPTFIISPAMPARRTLN